MSSFEEAVEDIKKAKSVLEDQPAKVVKHPDPVAHKYISFVKSFFRIAAGVALALAGYEPALASNFLQGAGGLLILAEVLGIAEEMV
jgi:hypothetical protein